MQQPHRAPRISTSEFAELLPALCDPKTSADPDRCTLQNPLWGHCAVVATITQDMFGGAILRAPLDPKANAGSSHYWNRLPEGTEVDFTLAQFGGDPAPVIEVPTPKTRAQVLYAPLDAPVDRQALFARTRERYKTLKLRIEKHLSAYNPLFSDATYIQCFTEALESPCQKMRFGCFGDGHWPHQDGDTRDVLTHNHPPDALKGVFCDPTCIRLTIQSRTESMLGDCGHAEEWALDGLKQAGDIRLWIAGFQTDGAPYLKKRAEHTCLRCAWQMYRAPVIAIMVPVRDHWETISKEEALKTATAYARGERIA